MKHIGIFLLLFPIHLFAQAWPAPVWSAAVNLTAVMDVNGATDLSGLHFNSTNNRLYVAQGDGRIRILQWDTTANTFSQIASKMVTGGPEGITQTNLFANEFYVIDENNYEIKRYTHNASFSTVTEFKHWNLLTSPSPMQDTGNTGPEGIVFIPDSYLTTIGFISQQTGNLYTSQKGMGGLMLIAHQDEGYVWVFDVNPNTNNDFLYVGKYQTNDSESCDLAFDRSTGLLYILHNIQGNNSIEVTNLSTAATSGGNRKFEITNQFSVADPNDANENIEGFAIAPKCSNLGTVSAWLCRDVESNEAIAIQKDALRWFTPFAADGDCVPLANDGFEKVNATVAPNPATNQITITSDTMQNGNVQLYNSLGQLVMKFTNIPENQMTIDVSRLPAGMYFVEINQSGSVSGMKWIKN